MAKERSRKTHAPMWLHRVLRWSLSPFFFWRFRPSSEHQEVVKGLKPPYIVIPNHVMTFDPALVNYFVPKPIHYVASDANFRNPLFSFLLRQVGAIATSKQADDMASLRLMLKTLKEGKIVGIFAEGQRSWDGVSLPLIPSTGKLVKIAKVPVLVSLLKGGYMTIPRWSFHTRRGRIVIEQKLAVTAKEAATLSVAEITARIEAALAHDDSEYQNEKRVVYASKRPAESLQLALFYCPSCSSLNTMNSRGRRFFCESCGYELEFTQYYRFQSPAGHEKQVVHFNTIREWSVGQDAYLKVWLKEVADAGKPLELFADDNAVMLTGYRLARLRQRGHGRLSFHLDGIRFADADDPERFFPWGEIKALNVVYQDQLEFYFQKTLFVFRFPDHDTSAYKYHLCGEMLGAIRESAG